MENLFLRLSETLTGFTGLNPDAANLYYSELNKMDADGLGKLLSLYIEKIKAEADFADEAIDNIYATDPTLKKVCQDIILIWYNAAVTKDGIVTWQAPPEFYFDVLLWKAVDAHLPAVSGGYFGYWRYAPEN